MRDELEDKDKRTHSDGEKKHPTEQVTIPIVEEDIQVQKQVRNGETVRVTRSVYTANESVDVEAIKEHVQVKRIPVDKEIDSPMESREENGVTVIPVMEEVVIVTKKLVLKEEIHITKSKISTREKHEIELEKQRVEIERLSPDEG